MLRDRELFLFDLDGTLYLGDKPIEGVPQTLELLRERGKRVCFVTNNSSKTAQEYYDKLNRIGIFARKEEIFTSALSTIEILKQEYSGKSVYLLATDAVKEEFASEGICLVEDNAEVCVMAYDTSLTYKKMVDFNRQLVRGAEYIATHPDKTCPHPEVYVPDCGAFMALFATSCDRIPSIICGKPFANMGQAVCRRYSVPSEKIVFFGDRMMTDIAFAKNCGFGSVLVLSGESTLDTIKQFSYKPDLVLENVTHIKDYL